MFDSEFEREPLASALAVWKRDDDLPDLAPGVLAALRTDRAACERASAEPPRRWSHAGAATLTAAALITLALVLPGEPVTAPTLVDADATAPPSENETDPESDAITPDSPSSDATLIAADAPPLVGSNPDPDATASAPTLPGPTLTVRDDLSPESFFSSDRIAAAWEILPDPNRTWRDEVRDGVRPFRDGADAVVTLFAEALPPPRRPY